MKDYYKILRVGKNAREEDIKKAYHNLALRYHPDKNREAGAEQHFKEILEAYQVLSDKTRRLKYDMDMELLNPHRNTKKSFSPWTNPYDSYNHNDVTLGTVINLLSKINHANVYRFEMYAPSRPQSAQTKEPPVERDIFVTLEEVNAGVTKKVKFGRTAYGGFRREEKVLDVTILPGCKSGTKIIFLREGDRVPGSIPADVVFVVREKPHAYFERIGSDLKFNTQIPLHMAINGNFVVNIPTLEGKIFQLPINDQCIKPNTIKYVPSMGLPVHNEPNKRGNLIVSFQIKYPDTMSPKTRKMIVKNLFK